jgi:hypothetical protein
MLRPMASVLQSLAQPTWSMLAVIAYLLAFVLNIASSADDADLAYAVDRDPLFYTQPLPSEFRRRLSAWRAVNTAKCIALLLAWVWVCSQASDSRKGCMLHCLVLVMKAFSLIAHAAPALNYNQT